MKKLLLGVFVAGVTQMAFATTTDELRIVSGSTTITITDNEVGYDTNPADGVINYSNSNVNGWDIFVTVGVSDSPKTSPALDLTSLTASCGGLASTTCAANPLNIIYSDIGFTQANTIFSTTYSSTQSGDGTTSESAYLDASNIIFGTTTPIGTLGPYSSPGGIGTVKTPFTAGPSPYSVTLDQVFTDGGSGSDVVFSVDGAVSGGVPEPGTVVLFGTVLALCTYKLSRRKLT
jgi:hypothetical protein